MLLCLYNKVANCSSVQLSWTRKNVGPQLLRNNQSHTCLILTENDSSTWLSLLIQYLFPSSGSLMFQGERHGQQNWMFGVAKSHGRTVGVATSHGWMSNNLSINPIQCNCLISLLRLLHYQLVRHAPDVYVIHYSLSWEWASIKYET